MTDLLLYQQRGRLILILGLILRHRDKCLWSYSKCLKRPENSTAQISLAWEELGGRKTGHLKNPWFLISYTHAYFQKAGNSSKQSSHIEIPVSQHVVASIYYVWIGSWAEMLTCSDRSRGSNLDFIDNCHWLLMIASSILTSCINNY